MNALKYGAFRPSRQDAVVFGRPWSEVGPEEIYRIGARRVFVLASTTLAGKSALEARVRSAVGERLCGFATGIRDHTPREDVITAAGRARAGDTDFIIAIGGGSVIDAAKLVCLCLAADIRDVEHLGTFAAAAHPSLPEHFPVRMAAIPTTLSGAEFTDFGGATDLKQNLKEAYAHPLMVPRFVVLDADITVHTPARLWLSTGIRALDHSVESICSAAGSPLSDATAVHSLKLLASGLRRTLIGPDDLEARLDSLTGAWLSTFGLQSGVPMGASHGIGHALGASAGVPHGETSCVMLPHVLRWNKAVNADRQRILSVALGDASADAGDLVEQLVESLGLPTRLRDVGVRREQFATIASSAFLDPWLKTNPRPVESPDTIMDLLEAAW